MLTSPGYFKRAFEGKIIEKVIAWHRAGRVDGARVQAVVDSFWRVLGHVPFSILPAALHRFLTDGRFAKEKLSYLFVRPIRLYFNTKKSIVSSSISAEYLT